MGVRIALTVVCTILPFFVLLRYYYTRDVFREPRGALIRTFLLGFAITVPAVLVEFGLGAVPLQDFGLIPGALYVAFVVAAIPEELLKLWVIRGYCTRLDDFDELMDGIVYGATAALGFAAVENVLYVAEGGLLVAAIRSVTSVPMHAMCGAILGYFVAQARLEERRGATWKGLGVAILVHGLYDFAVLAFVRLGAHVVEVPGLFWAMVGLLILFVGTLVVSWLGIRRLIFRLREDQLRAGPQVRTAAAPLVAHLHPHTADAPSEPSAVPPATGGSTPDRGGPGGFDGR